MNPILDKIDRAYRKPAGQIPAFKIGDEVKVFVRIKEGDKERLQAYTGTVIARKGGGATETFTVRRISFGEGVERVFGVHSPQIARLEVLSSSKVRRAKLYYLRRLAGKHARLKKDQESEAAAAPEAPPPTPGTQEVAQA